MCARSRRSKYLTYFGNGYAAMGGYIDQEPESRRRLRPRDGSGDRSSPGPGEPRHGTCSISPAGNPQEGEDTKLRQRAVRAVRGQGDARRQVEGLGLSAAAALGRLAQERCGVRRSEAPLPDLKPPTPTNSSRPGTRAEMMAAVRGCRHGPVGYRPAGVRTARREQDLRPAQRAGARQGRPHAAAKAASRRSSGRAAAANRPCSRSWRACCRHRPAASCSQASR